MRLSILIILLSLQSCSALKKVFHKEVHKLNSTSVVRERRDSIAVNDQFEIRSSRTVNENETILTWDNAIYVPFKDSGLNDVGIYIYPKDPNDYFKIDIDGEKRSIVSNRVPSKVVIKESKQNAQYDSLSRHSQIQVSNSKADSSHVKTDTKQIIKDKTVKRFSWWWLLLIILAYLIYRNWPKIKAFILTIMPI